MALAFLCREKKLSSILSPCGGKILVWRWKSAIICRSAQATWAYAERFGLDTLWSEDFENGRLYGHVRTRDPFVTPA